jgi:hypothetical protein
LPYGKRYPIAGIYQIAILDNVPSLVRSFVISALRGAIPKDLHDHFWIATSSSINKA